MSFLGFAFPLSIPIIFNAYSLFSRSFNNSLSYFVAQLNVSLYTFSASNLDIIVLDIYAAREINTFNISSKDLVDKIISLGKNAMYIPDFEECVSYVKNNIKENDILLTLGAGTVTKIGPMLIEK